jgi:aldose 1-epimerase
VILPSGEQYELAHGEQRAVIVEVGAGLRRYLVGERDVLDGYARDAMCRSGRGQVLLPWPNRLSGATYEFDGERHSLPVSDAETGSAIHGLVRWTSWSAVWRADDRITLEHVLHPQPGYPFTLRLRVEYRLGDDGLAVRTTAENLGDRACPFGVGHHPYIAAPSGRVDDLPLEGKPIGPKRYDDTLAIEGPWRLTVGEVAVWADETWRYVQLFTGDDKPDVARRALAVEPMTCPPNAFRSGEDLIRLEPGERFEGRWGISRS